MQNYNNQYLLYNLVRENNILKSQIDKLNNIITNNKSSTSENTYSELSKDEVTQLIKEIEPKEHNHTTSDITDLNLSNYATTEQLAYKSDSEHNHTSSDISDRISEYNSTSVVKYEIEGIDSSLFCVQGQYISNESYNFSINLWPFVFSTFSLTLVYNDQEYQITNESNIEKQNLEDKVYFKTTDSNLFIYFEDPKKNINFTIKDFLINNQEKSTQNVSIIYYPIGETDMNVDHLITAKSVKQYSDIKLVTKNEFNNQTHTTSQISDRISEYNHVYVNSSCQYNLPETSIFQFVDVTNYDYIHCTTTDKTPFSITLEIKSQFTGEESTYTYTNEDIPVNITYDNVEIKLKEESLNYDIQFRIISTNDIEGEFKVKNININGETKPDETISFEYTAAKYTTDMTSERLMTANAIRGYVDKRVEEILKEKGIIQ